MLQVGYELSNLINVQIAYTPDIYGNSKNTDALITGSYLT